MSIVSVSAGPAGPAVPNRFIFLEDGEKLPQEFGQLLATATHMAQGNPVSCYVGLRHSAMIRFQKDDLTCQMTVKPSPPETLSKQPFVCGPASVEDSLAVYYVNGLTAAGLTATISRTVAGHPVVDVSGRGIYRVELRQ